ncbi:MAG: hypothetical protein K1X53_03090 [Candidatus Sumerlaeaceae bacterium]|nr:hypothetical protein [Candidatus Sumerlaeaceae bacterium]
MNHPQIVMIHSQPLIPVRITQTMAPACSVPVTVVNDITEMDVHERPYIVVPFARYA